MSGAGWAGGGRPVPRAARDGLEEFLTKLRIGPHLADLWKQVDSAGWVFLEMPTGSGKSLGIPGYALLHQREPLWITLPTITATRGIHKTLSELVGQRETGSSWPWVGYGASGTVNYDSSTRVKVMTTGHAINSLVRIIRLHTLASKVKVDEATRAKQMEHWGLPGVVMLDEVHHPTTENFVIFMLLRHVVHTLHLPVKVIISSATLNSETLCKGLGEYPKFSVQDSMPHPLDLVYREDIGKTPHNPPYRDVLAKVPELIQSLLKTHPDPTVHLMVFLAGEECLQETEQALWKLDLGPIEVLNIFAGMPSHMLDELFTDPAPNTRRIYLCTNVAESSITVDVDIVVDTGYHKVLVPKSTAQVLEIERITRANARQRAGRTGRLRAGSVYRLYPEALMETMPEHAPYEFELIPPFGHVLKLYGAGLEPQSLLGFAEKPHSDIPHADDGNDPTVMNTDPTAGGASAGAAGAAGGVGGDDMYGLTPEERWLQSQYRAGGGERDDEATRPTKRARLDPAGGGSGHAADDVASPTGGAGEDDGPSSWRRYEKIVKKLLDMRLLSGASGPAQGQHVVTDLGKRVSAFPVSIPHAAMLVQLADRHSARAINDATLLTMCMFVAVLETGTPSKLLWQPPEARKDAQAAKDYAAEKFSQWFRKDDLEAFVALLVAMYTEAPRKEGPRGRPGRADHASWCRSKSVNDRVMRAVTGTLRQLVFQSFYCEEKAIDAVIDRVVKKFGAEPPDFDACRQTLWATFPEQIMSDAFAKGESPNWKVTYTLGQMKPGQSRNDFTQRWIVDTKRTLNTSYSVATSAELPQRILSMCMFKSRGKTGHLVQLASCIVLPPGSPQPTVSATPPSNGVKNPSKASGSTAVPGGAPKPTLTATAAPTGGASATGVGAKDKLQQVNLAFVEELQAQQKTLLAQAQKTTDKEKRKEILAMISTLSKAIAKRLGK